LQLLDPLVCIVRYELQEQDQGIAVAVDRVRTHAALRRQIVLEEAHDPPAKFRRLYALHGLPP